MSLKKKMNENPRAVACGAIAVILGVAACLAYPYIVKPKKYVPPENAYFYDLSKGDLFSVKAGTISPMDRTESGTNTQAVRAYVFSCTDCAVESERFVGYLLKLTDEGKRKFAETALGKAGSFPAPAAWDNQATLPGVMLGAPTASQAGARPTGKVQPGGAAFMVAAPSKKLGQSPNWVSLDGAEAEMLFKQTRARCEHGIKACTPPDAPAK